MASPDEADPVRAMAVARWHDGGLVVTVLVSRWGTSRPRAIAPARRVDRWCRIRLLLPRRFHSSALRACGAGRLAFEWTSSSELSVGSIRWWASGRDTTLGYYPALVYYPVEASLRGLMSDRPVECRAGEGRRDLVR